MPPLPREAKPAKSKDKKSTDKKKDDKKKSASKDPKKDTKKAEKKDTKKDDKKSSSKDPKKTSKTNKEAKDKKEDRAKSKDTKKDEKKSLANKDKKSSKSPSKANKEEKEPPKTTKKIDRGIKKANPIIMELGPETPSNIVKELKLGPKFMDIDGMNVVEEIETEDYFDQTRLDNYLVLAIREVIKGSELPRNPFPRILRSLKQSLWYNTSSSDILKRQDAAVDNFIDKNQLGYGICTPKRPVGIYGLKFLLEKVNLDTIIFIKKYFGDYLHKHFEKRGNYEVESDH